MAALRDTARDNADELRDGIAWVIVYRTGRSWHALPVWSDLEGDGWETDDLNEALSILKVDPDAVILNGYYCGHFGEDMTIDQLAAGIRWHYENGYNRLAYRSDIEEAQASIEEARKAAEAAGLPFSEKLADGAEDEPNPYIYDGSMTVTDFEMMQGARATHQEIAAVVEAHLPGIAPDKLDEIAHAAAGLHISPATMQRILEGFNAIAAKVRDIAEKLVELLADHGSDRQDHRQPVGQARPRCGPAEMVAPLQAQQEGPRPQEVPQAHRAADLRCARVRRRWELVTARCVGCGLYWNISIYQQIPRVGYTCPHCDSRIRAGETIKDIQASQNGRPQKPKGAQT